MTSRLLIISCLVAAVLIAAIALTNGGNSSDSQPVDGNDGPPPVILGYSACPPETAAKSLTGAGATFPFPLYSKQQDAYQKLCGTKINYQSIGSGAGIQQITAGTVDFGASDGIMRPEQEQKAEEAGGPILHIPGALAPVAVVYNLPGIKSGELRLTGDLLAQIFLGEVKRWNDPAIAGLNAGVDLPKSDITVMHRSDGSGTTNIFTDYLSKVSPAWKERVGAANAVKWPTGLGAQGNEGVAGQIKLLPGTIGYVELAFAEQVKLSTATLQNQSGRFVAPSLESASAAAQGVSLPDDTKLMLTNSSNPDAYPIVSFSWILAFVNQQRPDRGKALAHYLWWAIHDGQDFAPRLVFPPLPDDAVRKAEALIRSLRCGNEPCLAPATP